MTQPDRYWASAQKWLSHPLHFFFWVAFFRVCPADDTLVWLWSGQITKIQLWGLPCVFLLDGEIITVFQMLKRCQVVIVFTSASKQSVIRAPVNQPKWEECLDREVNTLSWQVCECLLYVLVWVCAWTARVSWTNIKKKKKTSLIMSKDQGLRFGVTTDDRMKMIITKRLKGRQW